MRRARAVEARTALEAQGERPSYRLDAPNEDVGVPHLSDRHEVGDLGYSIRAQEPCEQHVNIWQVHLLVADFFALGSDPEPPPLSSSNNAPKTVGESKCGKHM